MVMMVGMVGAISPTINYLGKTNSYSNTVLWLKNSRNNSVSPSPSLTFYNGAAFGGTSVAGPDLAPTSNDNYMTFDGTSQAIRYFDNANLQPGRGSVAAGNVNVGLNGYGATAAYSIQVDFRMTTLGGTLFSLGNGNSTGWPSYAFFLGSSIGWYVSTSNTGNDYSGSFTSGLTTNIWYRFGCMFFNSANNDANAQIDRMSLRIGPASGSFTTISSNITVGYPFNHQAASSGSNEAPVGLGIGSSINRDGLFKGDMKNVIMGRSRFW